jgi:hypothetical protein
MLRVVNAGAIILTLTTALVCAACQSPTDPDDTIGVDDFVEGSISPDPVNAIDSPDGKTYRVARNNEPDEIRVYDWKATFSASIRLNDTANDKDLDLAWPVKMTSVSVAVQQASGGIVTPPTGSDTVHSEYSARDSSGSSFSGSNSANSFTIDLWYDLPSLRKEALITVAVGLVDDDGRTFTKTIDVKVNP